MNKEYTLEEAKMALDKAKISLMQTPNSAFFVTLCFSLVHVFDDSVATASTNGRRVKYNINFFMGLSPPQRVFLLLHETTHCAYLHMLRLEGKKMPDWNYATDYVINLQLVERGFTMIPGGLLDFAYKGMNAEQVYALLPQKPPMPSLHMDDLGDSEGSSSDPGDAQTLEEDMKEILVRASMQSKMGGDSPGTIPGEIEVFIDSLLSPKLPWQTILSRYLRSTNKSDYTFKKPNRRFMPKMYLPSLQSQALENLTIAMDTSGSVSDKDFTYFVSELYSILRMMKPKKMTLVRFDTQITEVSDVSTVNELKNTVFTGRGGTDPTEVIEWINKTKPKLTLIFTDGEFNKLGVSTKHPVIWLIHNNPDFVAPFGSAIHYGLTH